MRRRVLFAARTIFEKGLTNTLMGYIMQIPVRGIEKEGWQMEEKGCALHKTKERSEEEKRRLIHRLNRIEGQVRGIRGMLEKDAYCPDILVQSAAVTAAMNAFSRELLASHIRGCVAEDIRAGHDEVIDELLTTLQKLMR